MQAEHAFVAAMATSRRSSVADDHSIDRLHYKLDEHNLLRARELALDNEWYHELASLMDSLTVLYEHGAYNSNWKKMLDEVVPHFVTQEGDPVVGREWAWRQIMVLRVEESFRRMSWHETTELQQKIVTWDQNELVKHPCTLVRFEVPPSPQDLRDTMLAGSLSKLGQLQANMGDKSAIKTLKAAYDLAMERNNKSSAAGAATGLGRAYFSGKSEHSLNQADEWFRRGIELMQPEDRHDLALAWWARGSVAARRFGKSFQSKAAKAVTQVLFQNAMDCYKEAAKIVPEDSDDHLGKIYDGMGELFLFAHIWDKSLECFDEAIKHFSRSFNVYSRGHSREQAGFVLFVTDRDSDAVAYLKLAISDFEASGAQANSSLLKAKKLLADVKAYNSPSSEKQ